MIWFLFWKISRTEKTRKQKQNLMLNTNIQYQIHNIIPHERNTPKTNTNIYFLIQKFLLPSERDLMTDCGYCRSFHHLCNKCRGIMYHIVAHVLRRTVHCTTLIDGENIFFAEILFPPGKIRKKWWNSCRKA